MQRAVNTTAHPGTAAMDQPAPFATTDPRASLRLGICLLIGLLVAGVLAAVGPALLAPLTGWDAAVLVYLVWMWIQIGPADADRTAAVAVREDNSRQLSDLVLLLAAVASLGGVGYVVALGAARNNSISPGVAITLAITSVALSWALVHTLFTLRYARLYYTGVDGGIDFNQEMPPRYTDFAYLAFTVGMTFQVSDTDLQTPTIRATVLRHALLSYLFGAVIISLTINLVAGLTK